MLEVDGPYWPEVGQLTTAQTAGKVDPCQGSRRGQRSPSDQTCRASNDVGSTCSKLKQLLNEYDC